MSPLLLRARRRHGRSRPDEGRLVVITGAGSGIGRATALAYAARGAALVLADVDRAGVEETARRARAESVEATAAEVDVSDAEAMARFAAEVERQHGAPDVVVNNAGIGAAGRFLETPLATWERILAVNLWGVLHGCRLFGAQMVARGEGGHIVNVVSMAAFAPSVVLPAYSTSKAAALMLTECLRAELSSEGIGVSAICPGLIDTAITRTSPFEGISAEDAARRRAAIIRLYQRRGLGPEVVARAIVRAVERDEAVVPVAVEAHALELLGRLTPGLARQLARVDITPR